MILFLFLLLFTLIFSYKRYRNALQPEKNGVLVRLYRGRKKRLYIKKKHRRRIGVPCACPCMKKKSENGRAVRQKKNRFSEEKRFLLYGPLYSCAYPWRLSANCLIMCRTSSAALTPISPCVRSRTEIVPAAISLSPTIAMYGTFSICALRIL